MQRKRRSTMIYRTIAPWFLGAILIELYVLCVWTDDLDRLSVASGGGFPTSPRPDKPAERSPRDDVAPRRGNATRDADPMPKPNDASEGKSARRGNEEATAPSFPHLAVPTNGRSLLPRNVITVFGPESSGSTFLATTLAKAVGVIGPEDKFDLRATSDDGEWEIQHLSLPWGWRCEEGEVTKIVEALVPHECFRYAWDPSLTEHEAASEFWKNNKNGTHAMSAANLGEMAEMREEIDKKHVHDEDEQRIVASRCRDEAGISGANDGRTCGAPSCGTGAHDGYALYPVRFFVNATSHIEWYMSRGVNVRVVFSMRDRTIAATSKLRDHCYYPEPVKREDEVAMGIMAEALLAYGGHGGSRQRRNRSLSSPGGEEERPRAIAASYEGLMEMKEAYLHGLYEELGIKSTYVPTFADGNEKYVASASTAKLNQAQFEREQRAWKSRIDLRPPKPQVYQPPPPRETLLPKRLITIVGTASDTSFDLTTALSVATGAFPSEGRWVGRISSPLYDSESSSEYSENGHELMYEGSVRTTATSPGGDWSFQHISLPWGSKCSITDHAADLVESLVPEECFRFESAAMAPPDQTVAKLCHDEVRIKEENSRSDDMTCGAKCGRGQHSGLALYPNRFFVNITSHIEWYLSRGVDVTVVLLLRDRSISMRERLKHTCPRIQIAREEEKIAQRIIKEAYEKYGKHASLSKSGNNDNRVITVSYEGLLQMREVLLFDLYSRLGIDSTYVPPFVDGNAKYVVAPKRKAKVNDRRTKNRKRLARE